MNRGAQVETICWRNI